MSKKPPLIILAGPTAVGKTELSISLAKAIGGEIISCDSMQVYKYMDIGSAKIRPEEMDGIRHYLVDELLPDEEFHVARFVAMAKEAMARSMSAGIFPLRSAVRAFIFRHFCMIRIFPKKTVTERSGRN